MAPIVVSRCSSVLKRILLLLCMSLATMGLEAQVTAVLNSTGELNVGTPAGTGLSQPGAAAVDNVGNVYIADTNNNRIVVVPPGGPGTVLSVAPLTLNRPQGVAVDNARNVYISDTGANRIVVVPPGGSGTVLNVGVSLSGPRGLAVDNAGNVYIVDYGNSRIVVVPPVGAGTVLNISPQTLKQPLDVAVDGNGTVYIADTGNDRIVVVPPGGPGTVLSVAPLSLKKPSGVAVDGAGNVYIADTNGDRAILVPPGGPASVVETGNSPQGVAVDSEGNFYLVDTNGKRIIGVTSTQNLGTVPVTQTGTPITLSYTISGYSGTSYTPVFKMAYGADTVIIGAAPTCTGGAGSQTCSVQVALRPTVPGLIRDAVLVYDSTGTTLLTETLVFGIGTSPLKAFEPEAGSVLNVDSPGGTPLAAPAAVAVDSARDVFIADTTNNRVVEVTTAGAVSVLPVTGLSAPSGVVVDGGGNVYIADTNNNRVVKLTPAGASSVLPVGTPAGAGLSAPSGLAVDGGGDVYIADTGNNRVIRQSPTGVGGVLIVGTPGGTGLSAPSGVAVDVAGSVYIADTNNNRLVKVPLGGPGNVMNVGVSLSNPRGVAVDAAGNIYIAHDAATTSIVRVPPGGGGTQLPVGSPNGAALSAPRGVAIDGTGIVYIADTGNNRVVKLAETPPLPLSFAQTNVGSTSSDSPQTVTLVNIGNMPLNISALDPTSSFNLNGSSTTCTTSTPLAAAATCALGVQFAPVNVGSLTGTVDITDDNLNVTGLEQVPLSGHGVGSTTITLISDVNPQVVGLPVVFTATVVPTPESATPPTGTVTFYDGAAVIGTGTLNGGGIVTFTTSLLAVGDHDITAVYAGDANYGQGTSNHVHEVIIEPPPVTIEPVGGSPQTAVYGNAFANPLVVVVKNSDGTSVVGANVTFMETGLNFSSNGTVSPNSITVTTNASGIASVMATGTHVGGFTATATTPNGIQTVSFALTVTPATLTVTASPALRSFGAPNPAFAATITGFVFSDTVAVVSGEPHFSTDATSVSPAGTTHPITVTQGTLAAANYLFTFGPGVLTITKATPGTNETPAVILTSNPNPSIWGDNVKFTATLPPGATGTVTFYDGTTALGTGQIFENTAAFSTPLLTVGTHPITAVYSGDTNFNGASSAVLSQVVNKAPLMVTADDQIRQFGQPNPPLTYTIDYTGLVNGDPTSVVSGAPELSTTATITSIVGPYPITVTQGTLAATNYSFTPVDGALFVTSITPTVGIASSLNPSPFNIGVTFTATVPAGATGTVTFYSGITVLDVVPITGNTATFTTSALAVGTHPIIAEYNGDQNHEVSTSAVLSQAVTLTTTTLTSSENEQIVGMPVTFTAQVIPTPPGLTPPPTGTVTFLEEGNPIGTGNVDAAGFATFTTSSLAVGAHTIFADYPGDDHYPPSTSLPVIQTIVPPLPETIEIVGGNIQSAVYGTAFAQPLTVVVTLSNGNPAPGVTVTFAGAGLKFSSNGTVTNGTATVTTGSNGHANVTATGTHVGALQGIATAAGIEGQEATFALTVTPAPLTITANNASRVFGATNPAFTATITGFVNNEGPNVVSGTPSFTTTATASSPPGTYSITVSQGTLTAANYSFTFANATLTVSKATPGQGGIAAVTVASSLNPSTIGSAVTFAATVPSGATGTVTFMDGTTAPGTATISGATATLTTATLAIGTHPITAVYSGDTNFNGANSAVLSQVVNATAADFTVANKTSPQLIPPGASASYNIAITSVSTPFTNVVALTASNLPSGASYTFNPAIVTPGTAGANSTLTISVPKQSAMLDRSLRTPLVFAVLLLPLALLRRARGRPQRLLLCLLVSLASFTAVNGCGTGGYFNQPQQTYIITVAGTSGSLVRTTTVTLTVQ